MCPYCVDSRPKVYKNFHDSLARLPWLDSNCPFSSYSNIARMNRNVVSPSRVPVWPYVWNMTKKMDMDSNPIWWIWSIPLVMWISPLKSSDIERSLGMLEWSECGKSDGFPAICCQPKELWSIKVGCSWKFRDSINGRWSSSCTSVWWALYFYMLLLIYTRD